MIAVHEFQSNQGKIAKSAGDKNEQDANAADMTSGMYGTRDSQAERIGFHDYRVPKSHARAGGITGGEHASAMTSINNS